MQEIELITRAAAFAAEAHSRQRRKASDQPYVNHLIRVAHAAARAGLSPEAIAAACLHDVIEDTGTSAAELRRQFPERVVRLVELLTKWWPDDAPPKIKQEGKPKYYGGILSDPEAIDLKLLDRADNLRDMIRILPKARGWAERYLRKTRTEIEPIHLASRNEQVRRAYAEALRELEEALRQQ